MTDPRQPVNRVVTERRDKTYQVKVKRGYDKGKINFIQGWEIVKEIQVCPACFENMTGLQARTVLPKIEPEQTERQKRRRFKDDRPFKKTKKKPVETSNRKKPVVEFVKRVPNVKRKDKS